jgi:DHA1 family bicyclomycin/chloramphenicol resistance-like MFS transporter
VAGLLQQLMGAVAGYVVGLVSHQGAFNLGLLMTAFSLVGAVALVLLHRR